MLHLSTDNLESAVLQVFSAIRAKNRRQEEHIEPIALESYGSGRRP